MLRAPKRRHSENGQPESEAGPSPAPIKRAKRMVRASQLDLVYPFDYVADPVGGLNPPFLGGSGPLVDQGGQLTLNVTDPIIIKNRSVDLAHDPSLDVNAQGQLAVAVDPEGALTSTPDGLDVKVDPSGGLDSTAGGLGVSVDDTLLVDQGELGVHLNQQGPITADSSGIDLEINPNMFTVNTSTGSGVLELNLKAQGGIQAGSSGVGVSVDESLEIVNNTLEVKPDPSGPLTVSANGLGLKYDNNTLAVTRGALTVVGGGSISTPIATFVSGSASLNAYNARMVIPGADAFSCAYYLQQWNIQGLLFTSLYLKLDSATMGNRPGDNNSVNAKWFTFWVSAYLQQCNSGIQAGTVSPSTATLADFEPMANRSVSSPWTYSANGYYEPPSGEFQLFTPVVTGAWTPGNIGIRVLPVPVSASGDRYTLLCYSLQCTNASIFNPNNSGTMIVGPVLYSCPAGSLP
uniref:Short fiber protein n=1 Tax=Fowl adenovirus C serotype 10 (strain SA2) TaxID=10547 RepID=O55281_ADEGX|nr:short fiber protein [Fowl aviadenovirus 10]